MAISYRKLFHILIDRNIKKGELQEKAGITASIMARLAKDETVKTDTIGKICDALNCQPGDIMENTTSGTMDVPTPEKPERRYEPFTEDDEKKVDFVALLYDYDGMYRSQIAYKYGIDVLKDLLKKARQQETESPDTE